MSQTKKVTITMTVDVPRVPNYVRTPGGRVAVGEMPEEDLRALAHAWTENLLANAERQRREGLEHFKPTGGD